MMTMPTMMKMVMIATMMKMMMEFLVAAMEMMPMNQVKRKSQRRRPRKMMQKCTKRCIWRIWIDKLKTVNLMMTMMKTKRQDA